MKGLRLSKHVSDLYLEGAEAGRLFRSVQTDVLAVVDPTSGRVRANIMLYRFLRQGEIRLLPSGGLERPHSQASKDEAGRHFRRDSEDWLDEQVLVVVNHLHPDKGARVKRIDSDLLSHLRDIAPTLSQIERIYCALWHFTGDGASALERLVASHKIKSFMLSKKSRKPNYGPTSVLDRIVEAL